jgi:hypothetical protein
MMNQSVVNIVHNRDSKKTEDEISLSAYEEDK